MLRSIPIVLLLLITVSLLGADNLASPNIIQQTQGQLGTNSEEQYMEFTATNKGFRLSYKIDGNGPYRLALLQRELDAGGSVVWKQVDIPIHSARGSKVGARPYRTAPAGTYRVQIIVQNATYQFAVDDPWTKPASQPSSNPAN